MHTLTFFERVKTDVCGAKKTQFSLWEEEGWREGGGAEGGKPGSISLLRGRTENKFEALVIVNLACYHALLRGKTPARP